MAAVLAAGCSSGSGRPAASARPAAAPTTTSTTVPPTTSTTVPPEGWAIVSTTAGGPAIEQKSVVAPDGSAVVLLRFLAGRTLFDLHVGSSDPPTRGLGVAPAAGPAVTSAQRPVLLGAFNGGFQTGTGVGGFEVDGVVLKPLEIGRASLVIDNGGRARVAVWGRDAPVPGESVASVRQNLDPLIADGQASPVIEQVSAWGATLGGGRYVARSALGTDSGGNLVYAASRSAVPKDLSTALLDAGCVTAMELDINPEWVQADVAAAPGAPLAAVLPGQSRPASQYVYGWSRDFVTAQAAA